MDDREIVASVAAGGLDGLDGAYDKHAESLYGYCHWMLGGPEAAADAVQDTFVIAAARLGGLGDPHKLRPWLYAVARNECHRRLRASDVGLDEAAELDDPPSDSGDRDDRAELRGLVRAALDGLNSGEREVIELDLRHDLHGADLAAVLGVPQNRAHTRAAHARGLLEGSLGVLLVARTGRRACTELDLLLDGWDGRLTALTRKQVSRHIGQCKVCADREHGALRPAALPGMAPLAAPPRELRDEVLRLCASSNPLALSYRRDVTQRARLFRPNGFPQAVQAPRRRMLALSGVAAAVGVLIAITATGIVTVIALTGSQARSPAAGRPDRTSGPASASATAGTGSAGGSAGRASPGISPASSGPATSAPAVIGVAPAATSSASSAKAKPAPSGSAASSAPAAPTPGVTPATATATPTPTPTAPATATAPAMPTPTSTPSLPF